MGSQKVTDLTFCDGCILEFETVATRKVMAKDGTSYISHQVVAISINFCTNEFNITPKQMSFDCK